MRLLRVFLIWGVGLWAAAGCQPLPEARALARDPSAASRQGLWAEADAQGLLHIFLPGENHHFDLSLQPEPASGSLILTGPDGQVRLPAALPTGGGPVVLHTAHGQLVMALPELHHRLDLTLTYDEREDRLVLQGRALEVVGADLAASLTLRAGETLSLGPGTYQVAGDLRLLAGHALQLHDAPARPLVARVGRQFVLEGQQSVDILALSHPDSVLQAGGDLVLRSAQPVRGDAHYLAGGQFRIEQLDGRAGHLVSPHDPIVLASQNVSLGNYTGASLHVLAGGSVTLSDVTITGSDAAANTVHPANATPFNGTDAIGSLAGFNLSDGTPVIIDGSTQPTLDVRAGVAWSSFAGGAPANQVLPPMAVTPTFSAPVTAADLTVGNITVSPPGGVVLLTNQYRPTAASGNITAGAINAGTVSPGGNGGAILLDGRDNVTAGNLNTAANVAGSAANNGGEVRVLAEGDLSTGNLLTFAASGHSTAGHGGRITLVAGGALTGAAIASYVESVTGSGNAGDISLTATGPMTLTTMQSFSRFEAVGYSGNAGDVTILVRNAGPLDGGDDLYLNYIWADSGAWYDGATAVGPSGDGANVSLVTEDGDIVFANWLWVQTLARGASHSSGDGGDVDVTATNGGITIGNFGINTRTQVASGSDGSAGQSGDVTLVADGDILINPFATNTGILADAQVLSGTAQGSGTVLVQSTGGAIDLGSNSISTQSFSNGGQAGSAGGITLEAAGAVNVRALNTRAISAGGSLAGDGGPVLVTGGDLFLPQGVIAASSATTGTAGHGGSVTILASGTLSLTTVNTGVDSRFGSGDAGDISLTATGPLTLTTLQSHSRFAGTGYSGDAGDVAILVRNAGPLDGGDDLHLTYIWADSGAWYNGATAVGPSGDGANVSLVTEDGDIVFAEWLWVQTLARGETHDSGDGGDITITAANGGFSVGNFGINTQSAVANGSSGVAGMGGAVAITATGTITNPTFGGISTQSAALAGSSLGGGAITLTSTAGDIDFGANNLNALANATSGQAGGGGNITLQAAGSIRAGSLRADASSGSGQAGNAGQVALTAAGDIALASINAAALGGAGDGAGGWIVVDAGQFFRATGTTAGAISLGNQGLAGSSGIIILHGGSGVTPFVVGDAATNGTAGSITTGDALLAPVQSYLHHHFEPPNIWILAGPLSNKVYLPLVQR